jgi:hypothetical protein
MASSLGMDKKLDCGDPTVDSGRVYSRERVEVLAERRQ